MSDETGVGLEYEELISQPYRDCRISGGFVHKHEHDSLYIRLSRDGEEPTTILLRPDEAAALAWCLTGVLWSNEMKRLGVTPGEDDQSLTGEDGR